MRWESRGKLVFRDQAPGKVGLSRYMPVGLPVGG
jgi:hypothetical protein